jgi:hypothetical protein
MRGDKIALSKGTIDINGNVDVAYTIGSPGLGYMINVSAVSAGNHFFTPLAPLAWANSCKPKSWQTSTP